MSVYGIVSEFNPFHNGHKYLIDSARADGADTIVCIMSGESVQRGELAITDKYYRAEMALRCGADLVLELPFPWCSAGAEGFARAGVHIAGAFCDTLFFGSECGDIGLLCDAAEICGAEGFAEEYKSRLVGSTGAAEAYFGMLEERMGRSFSSNDILGIEYIKAARELGKDLSFRTVKRIGGGYLDEEAVEGELQSATAIRRLIFTNGVESASEYMPSACVEILRKAFDGGEISDMSKVGDAMRLFFRLTSAEDLEGIADVDEGLASRICRVAREAVSSDMLEALRTKRYTDSRLRRAMLFCLTGVKKEDISAYPSYVNMLGANARGCKLLASKRRDSSIAVLAKAADIPSGDRSRRQAELADRICALYSMSLLRERPMSDMMRRSPIII
ncbi:MAG: nucleotidyltransferase family protein [Clostridia bacterium]|nr:nucleotidyltransferase family protein [Clostridia bacterium]